MTHEEIVESSRVRLRSEDPKERALALDELRDIWEFHGQPRDEVTRSALRLLLDVFARETDAAVLECALDAATTATSRGHGPLVSWEPLASRLATWEASPGRLASALGLLGASRDDAWRPVLERHTTHADSLVRDAALDALEELEGR